MPRPKKTRAVDRPPLYTGFKPMGVQGRQLASLDLSLDEYEALRLADHEGLDHADSADQMEISRSTFSRLVEQARRKVAQFLVEGKHLRIEGGDIHFSGNRIRCLSCGYLFDIDLEHSLEACPRCDGTDLVDMAGGFGHGRCCRRHQGRRGR